MGSSEEGKTCKTQKPSSPAPQEQTNNVHVYPDWAAMQAYYGPRVALPPYYNSAVASGHVPPPYMWPPPQAMMPPYGAPYAAIYSHGGVYAHPAVPVGSHPHANGISSSPITAIPLGIEATTKSTGTPDQGLLKKLKGFDGLAMSIGNGNPEGTEHGQSQSSETEGSSDGSNGNTSGADQSTKKRSREGTPNTGGDGKSEAQVNPVPIAENAAITKTFGATVTPVNVPCKLGVPVLSPGLSSAFDVNANTGSANITPNGSALNGAWLQNERELKRERRKQSNRESARRSRLRKQAETEELARKVDILTSENIALKSELNQLTETSTKLKLENATLMEKLKNAQLGQTEQTISGNDKKRSQPVTTENLLSRVDNSGPEDRNSEECDEMYEKKPNSGAKLHQLLDTNHRSDAVAAS